MNLYLGSLDYSGSQKGTPVGTVVTIGNFDGVHLGHQELIRSAVSSARQQGSLLSVAYTFYPHPQDFFRKQGPLPKLTLNHERRARIAALGVDALVEEPFHHIFSQQSAEEFFEQHLRLDLKAQEVWVGFNFSFGKGKEGNLSTLRALCKKNGMKLNVLPEFRVQNQPVSSGRVRELLEKGSVREAQVLLGYPYQFEGTVVRGLGRGRTIGIPTANLHVPAGKQKIPNGVYVTELRVQKTGSAYRSITNVGVRPTFAGGNPTEVWVESHVLGQKLDLVDEVVTVSFLEFLRTEKKFSGAQELVTQIHRDIQLAQSYSH